MTRGTQRAMLCCGVGISRISQTCSVSTIKCETTLYRSQTIRYALRCVCRTLVPHGNETLFRVRFREPSKKCDPSRVRFPSLPSWLVFSALPTRKSTLTGNEHSRSCGCPYTRKKAAPLGVMCQRVKRQKNVLRSSGARASASDAHREPLITQCV